MALRVGQLAERGFDGWDLVPVDAPTRTLAIDLETYSDVDLKKHGLDLYSIHPSCEVLMCAYSIDGGKVKHWDATTGDKMPRDLRAALDDDDFLIWAFNAQFERVILNRVLGIWPAIHRWRCTMVLAYMHSYTGDLGMVARQMGVDQDKTKLDTGKRLIHLFTKPQKVSVNQPHKRFTSATHPIEWRMFVEYNIRDVEAESEIKRKLDKPKYPIPAREWEFYGLDQIINDRGLPIDRIFVTNALEMANARKAELLEEMREKTGLANPGSGPQLLPWLKERGYPFDDLQKDSVKKVLTAWKGIQSGELKPEKDNLYPDKLTKRAVAVLKLRQQQARTSTTKYAALLNAMGEDGRMRYVFQFCGASRTGRFAGRRFQPQNLTMMRDIESEKILVQMTDVIRQNDYEALLLYRKEPLDALAGLVRSSVRAPKGKKLVVCDLASIESVVIGWVARCERLLNVFREGKDAYKDFATELFNVLYEHVTKDMRKKSKPATLGAGYRLGGGDIKDGKKTGLWGYGENMGIEMSRKEAHKSVAVFRKVYKEIPQCWYDLEEAIMSVIKRGGKRRVGPVTFYMSSPYLVCELPSGRCIYYKSPRIRREKMEGVDRETGERYVYWKDSISYMGKQQNGSHWLRINSHGGKFIENCWTSNTRVLTPRGPVPIVDVRPDDLVWDGEMWVEHGGLVESGERGVIPFAGYACTADHRIDVDREWVRAEATSGSEATSSFARHYRLPDGYASGTEIRRSQRGQKPVVGPVRLRLRVQDARKRIAEAASDLLRMCPLVTHRRGQPNSRYEPASSVLGVAFDARQVPVAFAQSVEKLRWKGHHGLSRVGRVIRDVLAGHGGLLARGLRPGAQGQHVWLQQGQLCVGHPPAEYKKQTQQPDDRHAEGVHAVMRSVRLKRGREDDTRVPGQSRVVGVPVVRPTYDLLNCGPNHRFTIISSDGQPILVHNCVQAIARDILREGMLACHKAGFRIVLHVHDEIVAEETMGDEEHNYEQMRLLMIRKKRWMSFGNDNEYTMPLNAAGTEMKIYRKD